MWDPTGFADQSERSADEEIDESIWKRFTKQLIEALSNTKDENAKNQERAEYLAQKEAAGTITPHEEIELLRLKQFNLGVIDAASEVGGVVLSKITYAAGAKTVQWTAHGFKHVAKKGISWKKIINGTKSGPAKYSRNIDIEKVERYVWKNGDNVVTGKKWKIMEFDEVIGASNGKESIWIRVESSGGTIHGHPIKVEEFKKLKGDS